MRSPATCSVRFTNRRRVENAMGDVLQTGEGGYFPALAASMIFREAWTELGPDRSVSLWFRKILDICFTHSVCCSDLNISNM